MQEEIIIVSYEIVDTEEYINTEGLEQGVHKLSSISDRIKRTKVKTFGTEIIDYGVSLDDIRDFFCELISSVGDNETLLDINCYAHENLYNFFELDKRSEVYWMSQLGRGHWICEIRWQSMDDANIDFELQVNDDEERISGKMTIRKGYVSELKPCEVKEYGK